MKTSLIAFCVLLPNLLLWPHPILAKEDERRIEEEARESLASTQVTGSEDKRWLSLGYGGWFHYSFIDNRDDDNSSSVADTAKRTDWLDSRIWLKAALN